MKKFMFLTMVFGLMMVFSGSASAQLKGNVVAPCPGGFKLQVNDTLKSNIFETLNNSQGKKAYVNFYRNNKPTCTVNITATQKDLDNFLKGKKIISSKTSKVTQASFDQSLRTGDLMTYDRSGNTITLSFSRGKKVIGTATAKE